VGLLFYETHLLAPFLRGCNFRVGGFLKLVYLLMKQSQLDLAFFFNFKIPPYPFVELVLGGLQGPPNLCELLKYLVLPRLGLG